MTKRQKVHLMVVLTVILLLSVCGSLVLLHQKQQEEALHKKQYYQKILAAANQETLRCNYIQAENLLDQAMQYLPEEPEAYLQAADLRLMQHDVDGALEVLEKSGLLWLNGEMTCISWLQEMDLMQNGLVPASKLGNTQSLLQARLVDLDFDGNRELLTVTLSNGKLQPSVYQFQDGAVAQLAEMEPISIQPLDEEASGEAYFHAFLLPENDCYYLGYSAYYDPWKHSSVIATNEENHTSTLLLPDETTVELADRELDNHAGSMLYLYRWSAEGIKLDKSYDASKPDPKKIAELKATLQALGLEIEAHKLEEPYYHLSEARQQHLIRIHLTAEGADFALSWQAPVNAPEDAYQSLTSLFYEANSWFDKYYGPKPPRLWNGTLLSVEKGDYRFMEKDLNADGFNELYLLKDGALVRAWAYNGHDFTCFLDDGLEAQLYDNALKIADVYYIPNQWGALQAIQTKVDTAAQERQYR